MKLTLAGRDLLNALSLYLATRRTSLRAALQMRAPLSAEQTEDLRIHYSSYFISLLSAIETIREDEHFEPKHFTEALESALTFHDASNGSDNYAYIRELRNAIVHRGLDIFSAAHFKDNFPLIVAPNLIPNRGGKRKFASFSFYLLGVIERCETAVGPTLESHLGTLALLDKAPDPEESFAESLGFINQSAVMPPWAKEMARASLGLVDFHDIHKTSTSKLLELLKPCTVIPQGWPNQSFNPDPTATIF